MLIRPDWISLRLNFRNVYWEGKTLIMKKLTLVATAALAMVFAVSSAQAAVMKYSAKLDGKSESPATESKGTGTAKLAYDDATKKLTYTVTYKGLTDAVAAHFHGPADAGANGGVELPITEGVCSVLEGQSLQGLAAVLMGRRPTAE